MCQIRSSLRSINKTRIEHHWLTLQMEQYYQTKWLISFLLPERMGRTKFNEFVKQKVIENPSKFWEKISKVNTPTFETLNEVMTVPISKNKEKVIKYDKDLFQRFVVVSRSREIDLQDILSYELSPVPLSIAHRNESQGRISPYKFLVPCLSVRVKFTNQ